MGGVDDGQDSWVKASFDQVQCFGIADLTNILQNLETIEIRRDCHSSLGEIMDFVKGFLRTNGIRETSHKLVLERRP